MKKFFKTKEGFAVFSLILSALIGVLMGIWVRLMAHHFGNFQQIALRATIGGLLGLVIYSFTKKIKVKTLFKISKLDFFYIFLRTTLMLIGIGMFTFAINNGNFSNINMIYALPTTAIFGFFILKEKLTLLKLIALIIGFLGAALIAVKNFHSLSAIGAGEIAALVSTFFYSGSYIARKFISKSMNNEEIAVLGSLLTGIFALLVSLFLGNQISNFYTLDWSLAIVAIAAGLNFIFIGTLNNYGFEHVEAIVANNLLVLSAPFGLLIGIFMYKEVPTTMGLIGGLMVVLSAVMINYFSKK